MAEQIYAGKLRTLKVGDLTSSEPELTNRFETRSSQHKGQAHAARDLAASFAAPTPSEETK